MSVLKIKKVEIIGLQSEARSILEEMQQQGVVEIIQTALDSEAEPEFIQFETASRVAQFDRNSLIVQKALDILDFYSPNKISIADSFKGREKINRTLFNQQIKSADKYINTARKITQLKQNIDDATSTIHQTELQIEQLSPWKDLDIPQSYKGSTYTSCFVGNLPDPYSREDIIDLLSSDVFAEIVFSASDQTALVVITHKNNETEVWTQLRSLGFTTPSDPTKHNPSYRLKRLAEKIEALKETVDQSEKEIKALAKHRSSLTLAADYLKIRKDKYETLHSVFFSKRTFIVTGYLPEKVAPKLQQQLEKCFQISFILNDPGPEEDIPTILSNNLFASPLEDITQSYSLPGKGDIDPSFIMGIFYYFFFGMMLADAAYGLIIIAITAWLLATRNPEGANKQNLLKFLYCGISTFIWGALYGSWFGNLIYSVSSVFFGKDVTIKPLWFDPVQEPLKLLIFSLAIGFLQILVGLVIKFISLWRSKQRFAAIFDIGSWWLIFLGLGLLGADSMIASSLDFFFIGSIVAIVGALGLVFTQGRNSPSIFGKILGGIASLYSITGYFSDIMSYSRLMALGLVGGIIGTVVNTIGTIPGKNVGGIILFILIFILGHSINIGISFLGAYVHNNRLQYVEFFSKFYEGGGRIFQPFRVNTDHFKIEEEN